MRVLIADDHPLFRAGLRAVLEVTDGVEVVGEAGDGTEAVRAASALRPDVVVMDVHMPGMDGVEATRRILAAHPETGIVVLTMLENDDSVLAAMRAGARGYLLKGAEPDEIERALIAVSRGEALFGPTVARRVVELLNAPRGPRPFPDLTEREREVLELIAQGRSNPHIAAHFVLSEKTVRNHVSNILTKLRVTDRSAAIVRAREAGFGGA